VLALRSLQKHGWTIISMTQLSIIPNYSVARRDRVSRTGGGVCAFVKSYIPFKVLTELHDDNFETLW
jgi:DNA-binding GntR family transcriptional regulator